MKELTPKEIINKAIVKHRLKGQLLKAADKWNPTNSEQYLQKAIDQFAAAPDFDEALTMEASTLLINLKGLMIPEVAKPEQPKKTRKSKGR